MTAREKILFLAPQPFYRQRGTPIAVRAAVEVLAAHGYEVDLLTYFAGRDLEIPGVRIHRIRRPPLVRDVPIGPSWQKIPCDVFMLYRAGRMLSEAEPGYDVIHGVEDGAILAWILTQGREIPYVFDMDSHMSGQIAEKNRVLRPLSRLFAPLEAAAIRGAAGVLAVCPALADIAREQQDPDRVALLPDMPLNEDGGAAPADEVEALDGTRIVYVGNLEEYQGIDLLLTAFGQLAPEHPDARLVVVGGTPERINHYTEKAESSQGNGRVHFLGPRPLDRLGSILAAADVLVSPRLQGVNTPMKIYSYLESGRPVVATRLRTHTQVLNEDVACLVDPDPESLAAGLARLLADPQLRQGLGTRGREFVRAEFGRERYRERLTGFYERIFET